MLSNKEIVCPNNLLDVAHKKKGVKAAIVNAGKPLPMLSIQDAVNENLIEPIFIGDKKEIQKCMVKLINHGYKDVGSFDDVFDFKTKLTIIQYQLDKAIKVTGEFDEKTKTKLDC